MPEEPRDPLFPEARPPRERRRGRKRRLAAYFAGGLVLLAVLLLGFAFFLTRTHAGQQVVLEQVLQRLQGAVNGRITVEDIRSGDLVRGVTLYDLEIVGPDSRPFFRADSVRATYAWRTFVSGDVVLSSLLVFGGDLRITRYPGEEEFNVDRILRTGGETDTIPGPSRDLIFRDVRLVDGMVEILYPAPEETEGARLVLIPSPVGEGQLRRIRFDDIDAELPLAVIASRDVEGPEVTVAALNLRGQVYEDPFRVEDLAGKVVWADGRLTVDAEKLRLPDSRASGTVVADFSQDDGLILSLDLQTPRTTLADLQWLEPRLPDGTAQGEVGLVMSPEEMRWSFSGFEADLDGSQVDATGDVTIRGERFVFRDLDLRFSPLGIDRIRPFVAADIPVRGTLTGRVTLDGDMDDLRAQGRLTLREPGTGGPPTTVDLRGLFHLEDGFGVTDLRATVDPLNWDLVARLAPSLDLGGRGRAEIRATGSLAGGLRFDITATHERADLPRSRVLARGSIRESGDEFVMDVHADVSPLSLTALRQAYPTLPVTGEVSGSIRAVGALSDLRVTTDLATEAGQLAVEARFDVRDPGAYYSIEGDVVDFRLSALAPELPAPTVITGYVDIEGRGLDPATADANVRFRIHDSRVGGLFVDTARAAFTVQGGVLRVDTLDALAGGVSVQGEGTLAMREGSPAGEIHVAFQSDSIGPLRPLLFGDSVVARDELSALDRALLELEGVDPDTLPTSSQLALEGRVRGDVYLRGSLESLTAEGEASFEELRYGDDFIESGTLVFSATELPSFGGEIHAELQADSMRVFDRSFSGITLEVDYTEPRGRFDVFLSRTDQEDYRATAAFELDTLGGAVALEELALRFDTLVWHLESDAVVAWNDQGVRVEDLVLTRPGPGSMRITVDGVLPREGEADFTLELEQVRIDRLAQILQREDLEARGIIDLSLRVTGTADSPTIVGTLVADDLEYRDFDLDRLEGDLDYRDQEISVDLEAWQDARMVFTVRGSVPADLALTGVEERIPADRQIDLAVVADSLAASFALGFIEALESVEGTVSADFRIQGTVEDPEPTGTLVLENAAWIIPAIGVRQEVRGTLTLNQDATVDVDAVVEANGTATVTGSLSLEPLINPSFDLEIVFDRFLAVERRDVTGSVSGAVALTGSYDRPMIRGLRQNGRGLRVDEGVLFLEEFQRAATVIDLSDPLLFDAVDTTFARSRPILAESQNPFLNNLRVDVDLAVENNTWLRSPDMNVEIGGSLVVTYDRRSRDLVLVGDLEALRGTYAILGRRFDVERGQVEFVGTPGINPNLNIVAQTRVRRASEPLVITATVSGTLVDPRVELSSEEQAIAESDLVSYLIFGRPSYELASGQARVLEGAAGSFVGATLGGGLSVLSGTLTSSLSSLVAQRWGLDYFAINQPDLIGLNAGTVAGTTVEVGTYLTDDIFAILVLRPLTSLSGASSNLFAGIRVEWRATDLYHVEAFIEDRFLRGRAFGFQDLGFRTEMVKGFLVVWEWGY